MLLRRRTVLRGWLGAALLAALPWTWFLLRDGTGRVGDLLAIILPPVVALLATIGLVLAIRRRRLLLPVASVLVVGMLAVLGPWRPADAGTVRPGAAVTVVGANVMGGTDAAAALRAVAPDVLVVAEMAPRLEPLLAADHPYRTAVTSGPSVGVFSRFPLRLLDGPRPDLPGLRVEVAGPAGPFVLYALHVPRPWFTTRGGYQATVAEHHRIMDGLDARVAAERLPVVVVGDLNSPDRGRDYRRMLADGGLVDAVRDRMTSYSSIGKWTALLLRIDHVLVSTGWCGDAGGQVELPGSDHRGVTASVGPCAATS